MKSLKNKITVFVVASIIVFGILAAVAIAYYSKTSLQNQKKEEIAIQSINMTNTLNKDLSSGIQFIYDVATNDILVSSMQRHAAELKYDKEVMNFIQGLKVDGTYKDILIYDTSGNVIAATDEKYLELNFGYRDYFIRSMEKGSATEVVVNGVTRETDIIFSHRISIRDNEPLGIVLTIMGADNLISPLKTEMMMDMEGNDEEPEHIHMLIDENGVVVASDNPRYVYKSLGTLDENKLQKINRDKRYGETLVEPLHYDNLLEAMGRNSMSIIEYDDKDDGEQELLSISPLIGAPFYIAMEFREGSFLSEISKIYYGLGLLVLVSAVMAAGLIYYFLNRFLLPLKQLKHAAESISKNNFNYSLSIKSDDEFEELGDAFNSMAIELKNTLKEVDRKVKAQTEDILKKQNELESQKKAALNILEDIAQEKERSERLAEDLKKFQLAIDNASDQIIITDENGKILYANRATEIVTEYSQKETLGKTPALFGKLMTKGYYKKMWTVIKNEKSLFVGNLTNIRKSGERYEAELKISPILDKNGEVKFFVGISRDVTKAREIDRAKTEFVSLASHQLRTPLTAIKWHTEMLLDGDLGNVSEDQKECVAEIFHSNERMIDLVNSLLNVSRIDMGTFAIDPEATDLIDIIESVLSEIEVTTRIKELSIKKNFAAGIPIVKADPLLLRIVFQNLLSNAAKYTPAKGSIAISVNLEKDDIIISVSDSGCGIPKKSESKIFTKLYRADNAKELDADGSGLGLYVAKSVVEQSGGRIWFDSVENKGTTFYFTIPLSGMKHKEGSKALSPSQVKK